MHSLTVIEHSRILENRLISSSQFPIYSLCRTIGRKDELLEQMPNVALCRTPRHHKLVFNLMSWFWFYFVIVYVRSYVGRQIALQIYHQFNYKPQRLLTPEKPLIF